MIDNQEELLASFKSGDGAVRPGDLLEGTSLTVLTVPDFLSMLLILSASFQAASQVSASLREVNNRARLSIRAWFSAMSRSHCAIVTAILGTHMHRIEKVSETFAQWKQDVHHRSKDEKFWSFCEFQVWNSVCLNSEHWLIQVLSHLPAIALRARNPWLSKTVQVPSPLFDNFVNRHVRFSRATELMQAVILKSGMKDATHKALHSALKHKHKFVFIMGII